jgi:predicted transposase YdaD
VLLKLAESSNESEKERLVECMSGQVIETEAHLLYVAGKEEGRDDGRREGIQITKAVIRLDAEGYAVSDIATELSISEDEVKQILE